MTVKERVDDIVKRSGLSEDIVRRVIKAEIDSVVDSLIRGKSATLIGRCRLEPYLAKRIDAGGKIVSKIAVRLFLSSALKSRLEEHESFINNEDNNDLEQVEALW